MKRQCFYTFKLVADIVTELNPCWVHQQAVSHTICWRCCVKHYIAPIWFSVKKQWGVSLWQYCRKLRIRGCRNLRPLLATIWVCLPRLLKCLLGLIPGCQTSCFWLVWDPNHRPNASVFDNQSTIFLQIVSVVKSTQKLYLRKSKEFGKSEWVIHMNSTWVKVLRYLKLNELKNQYHK